MNRYSSIGLGTLAFFLWASAGQAEIRPEKIHLADAKKNQSYIKDGLITGGDRMIDGYIVKDIRRAANATYERVVIDLEGNRHGEPAPIDRAPYYQVSVTPDEKRLVFTLYGKSRLSFDAKKVTAAFKKSTALDHIDLLPAFDDGTWTFALGMKAGHSVEVFELANPVRIILDIRNH